MHAFFAVGISLATAADLQMAATAKMIAAEQKW